MWPMQARRTPGHAARAAASGARSGARAARRSRAAAATTPHAAAAEPAGDPGLASDAVALHRVLSDLTRMLQFRDRDRICCHDVSVTQCYALEALVARGEQTLNELAGELYLAKSTARRVVDALVARRRQDAQRAGGYPLPRQEHRQPRRRRAGGEGLRRAWPAPPGRPCGAAHADAHGAQALRDDRRRAPRRGARGSGGVLVGPAAGEWPRAAPPGAP